MCCACAAIVFSLRYETVLHVGVREKDAFGGRTHRFLEADNDLPGPGLYYKQSTMLRSASNCGSVSHKGYGSLVSKTDRFNSRDAMSC